MPKVKFQIVTEEIPGLFYVNLTRKHIEAPHA